MADPAVQYFVVEVVVVVLIRAQVSQVYHWEEQRKYHHGRVQALLPLQHP